MVRRTAIHRYQLRMLIALAPIMYGGLGTIAPHECFALTVQFPREQPFTAIPVSFILLKNTLSVI